MFYNDLYKIDDKFGNIQFRLNDGKGEYKAVGADTWIPFTKGLIDNIDSPIVFNTIEVGYDQTWTCPENGLWIFSTTVDNTNLTVEYNVDKYRILNPDRYNYFSLVSAKQGQTITRKTTAMKSRCHIIKIANL